MQSDLIKRIFGQNLHHIMVINGAILTTIIFITITFVFNRIHCPPPKTVAIVDDCGDFIEIRDVAILDRSSPSKLRMFHRIGFDEQTDHLQLHLLQVLDVLVDVLQVGNHRRACLVRSDLRLEFVPRIGVKDGLESLKLIVIQVVQRLDPNVFVVVHPCSHLGHQIDDGLNHRTKNLRQITNLSSVWRTVHPLHQIHRPLGKFFDSLILLEVLLHDRTICTTTNLYQNMKGVERFVLL